MADERTASNFTWFNSSLRNRQSVGTLTWMTQIRQWLLHLVRPCSHACRESTTDRFVFPRKIGRANPWSGLLSPSVTSKTRSMRRRTSKLLTLRVKIQVKARRTINTRTRILWIGMRSSILTTMLISSRRSSTACSLTENWHGTQILLGFPWPLPRTRRQGISNRLRTIGRICDDGSQAIYF